MLVPPVATAVAEDPAPHAPAGRRAPRAELAIRAHDVCDRTRALGWVHADGELSAIAVAALESHLARCAGCRARSRADVRLRAAIDRAGVAERARRAPAALRSRVVRELAAATMVEKATATTTACATSARDGDPPSAA